MKKWLSFKLFYDGWAPNKKLNNNHGDGKDLTTFRQ